MAVYCHPYSSNGDPEWGEKKMEESPPFTVDPETEYRLMMFLSLGVPLPDAEALAARRDVDWHVLQRLTDKGCDMDTALRIVC